MSKTAERPSQLPTGYYVSCPHCEDELKFSHKYVGLRTACRKCGGHFSFDITEAEARLVAVFAHCPHCTEELRAIPAFMGKNVACNQCDGTFPLASRRLAFLASLVYRDEHDSENAPAPADSAKSNQSVVEARAPEAPPAAESQVTEGRERADEEPPETNAIVSEPTETRNSDSAIADLFDDETSLFDDDPSPDDAIILGESSGLLAEDEFDRLVEEETSGWYCKVLGQTLGPMSLDELKELVRDQQIERGDRVRCGETGEWQSPLMVASLLPDLQLESLTPDRPTSGRVGERSNSDSATLTQRPPVESFEPSSTSAAPAATAKYEHSENSMNASVGGASCAVAEVETAVRTTSTDTIERKTSPPPARTPPPVVPSSRATTSNGSSSKTGNARARNSRLPGPSKPTPQKKSTPWKTPRPAPTLFSRKGMIAVGTASVLALAFVVWTFDLTSSSTMKHYKALQSLSEEFVVMREKKVSRGRWAQFHSRSMAKLIPIAQELTAAENRDDPATQALLRAARDHLPAMYVDAQYGTSKNEEAFHKDMKEAEAYLHGTAPNVE